jgi:ATP-dependent DNA ligase
VISLPRSRRRTPLFGLSDRLDTTPAELIPLVKEFGFEGIIAKRKDSCYEIGRRSGAWLKIQGQQRSGVCDRWLYTGNPLDSVIGGYYEGDQLLYAAKVRNGFVPRLRRELWHKLKGLEIADCPFANLEKKRTQWALTREEMKNCVWLKPELVAQIEFNGVDTGRAFAAFKVCRTTK